MDYTYIKMCRAIPEIQSAWEPKIGDAVTSIRIDDIAYLEEGDDLLKSDAFKEIFCWMPRFEDLTKMYQNARGGSDYSTICDLGLYIAKTATADDIDAPATEWMLRLLMYALFNKSWVNDEWENN